MKYRPPDPIIDAFHQDSSVVRGIRGPRGSGKSGACIMEGLQGALAQKPNASGIRRSKFLVLRDTYRQLETTTIPSFRKWLGDATRISGSYPVKGYTHKPLADGTTLSMETTFLAMDGENVIDNLQSFEASFAWVNEARAIANRNVVSMVLSSTGRFPSKDEEGCQSAFVVMDTNPSDEHHWWYDSDMKETPDGWRFFAQEPPLEYLGKSPMYVPDPSLYVPNLRATYARIQNKGYNYWLDLVSGSTDAFIRTMIMGQYGTVITGRGVLSEFWSEECASRVPLEWSSTGTIVIGIDTSGLHPGAAFTQARSGRINVLRERWAQATPFDEFVEAVLLPTINENFRLNPVLCVCDPSNPRSGIGGKTAVQILQKAGLEAVTAPTNMLNRRLGALTKALRRRGALMIDPSCDLILAGMRGKYEFKKLDTSGLVEAYKPTPEKNKYADVMDGLGYALLYYDMGIAQEKVVVPVRRVLYA
jgi:hypothetical protein